MLIDSTWYQTWEVETTIVILLSHKQGESDTINCLGENAIRVVDSPAD